ncbi:hypothetical protein OG704_19495 [Streptomyces sp. NBC_00869]|uniref:hypothetical protein n=1 Tax=Streptomyces sp. NBC_00869 TaxID=2903684 RepID=UPI002ED3749A|nr:hypothetical protein OG704_19495 [Streptomyces sp. NBC_00869]
MSARRCTTGSSGPDGAAPPPAAGGAPGGSAPSGSPSPGRTAPAPATGAGTPDDGTAATVRGDAFAGRRAMISGGAVRRARTGVEAGSGDAVGSASRAEVETTRTARLGALAPRPVRGVGLVPVPPPEGAVPSSGGAVADTARSTRGAPSGVLRGVPGVRVTPWMRPTGADGSTAWPRSPSL